MKQNKYDDPDFFESYSGMPRSTGGLEEAGEWQAFRSLLPDLRGARVLDIGCGFGWHCRHAREAGASAVLGIDLSERMLERARAMTSDPTIVYRRLAAEDLELAAGSFEVILSSLALHYLERFDRLCATVACALVPNGAFVFSVEHPIFTAREAQDWHYGAGGERLHWPVDDYQREGVRRTRFLGNDVVKYHRTLATLLNTLIDHGLRIDHVVEPEPPAEMVARRPELAEERRRPMFLLVRAVRMTA